MLNPWVTGNFFPRGHVVHQIFESEPQFNYANSNKSWKKLQVFFKYRKTWFCIVQVGKLNLSLSYFLDLLLVFRVFINILNTKNMIMRLFFHGNNFRCWRNLASKQNHRRFHIRVCNPHNLETSHSKTRLHKDSYSLLPLVWNSNSCRVPLKWLWNDRWQPKLSRFMKKD